ncbi:STN domain-containing protein [Aeoliella sp. ICT_H6.2]|uniref:STN domain-containing protein n=1 Tax=Aeoliella straminimaris TaxID=2954799 RepID=A0A9X2JG55_9BACT|nr:STN domain-containing protein [Aeoliella straminimaris]MCO6043153.1 STN domain-containing protein [Aeoliella straminimaris]
MSSYFRPLGQAAVAIALSLVAMSAAMAQQPDGGFFAEPVEDEEMDPFGTPTSDTTPLDDPFGTLEGDNSDPSAARPGSPPSPAADGSAAEATPVFWAVNHLEQGDRIQQALREPLTGVGLQFDGAPLSEVVNFLRDEYHIEIQIDAAALDDFGISPDESIHVNLRNISLGAALRIMLKQLELTYVISDEILLITSEEEALTRLQVAVYPVGDLLAVKQGYERDSTAKEGRRRPEDIETLVGLIHSTIASDTWVQNGGPEGDIATMQPGLLVVSQTQDVHEQIVQLLAALRRAKQSEFAVPYAQRPEPKQKAERYIPAPTKASVND